MSLGFGNIFLENINFAMINVVGTLYGCVLEWGLNQITNKKFYICISYRNYRKDIFLHQSRKTLTNFKLDSFHIFLYSNVLLKYWKGILNFTGICWWLNMCKNAFVIFICNKKKKYYRYFDEIKMLTFWSKVINTSKSI